MTRVGVFFRSGGVRGETFSPRVPSAAREISARLDVCVLGKLSPSPEMSWVVLHVILFAPAIMARREDSWSAAAYLNSANLNRLALSSRDRKTCCKNKKVEAEDTLGLDSMPFWCGNLHRTVHDVPATDSILCGDRHACLTGNAVWNVSRSFIALQAF